MNETGTNGDHKRFDQDIRELRTSNDVAHGELADSAEANFRRTFDKIDALKDSVAELRGDSKGGKWVVRVLWALTVIALPALGFLFGSHEGRLRELEVWRSSHNTADNVVRADVNDNTLQIDRLRALPRDSDVLRHGRE